MGLLDTLLSEPGRIGDLAKFATDNPEIAKAALDLFDSSEGGLGGILSALQSSGLGDTVSSWLGSGANTAISPAQVKSALGSDKVAQFAKQAGLSDGAASAALAGMLPSLVDKLSPDGKLPDRSSIEGILRSFMRVGNA